MSRLAQVIELTSEYVFLKTRYDLLLTLVAQRLHNQEYVSYRYGLSRLLMMHQAIRSVRHQLGFRPSIQ